MANSRRRHADDGKEARRAARTAKAEEGAEEIGAADHRELKGSLRCSSQQGRAGKDGRGYCTCKGGSA
eukprot:2214066-Heterocapsa_arctica.AAC.1